tara:strand:+ start:1750 stop:3765 length:2016 start_codon:yes stop_codon:yes gene_type:complete
MKVSYNWIKEFVPGIKKNNISDQLTSLGLEVSSAIYKNNDLILDIDLTPNRADCLSVIGISKDLRSIHKTMIKEPLYKKLHGVSSKKSILKVDKKISSNYNLLTISNINNKISTPKFIINRLSASQIKHVNFIVDILNYVMLENGQPMHAFDKDKFNGKVNVRFAKKNEKINALDSNLYNLENDMPVIADDCNVHAIAGIIGSTYSSITKSTKNLMIESAFFDPNMVRRTAKTLRIQTDASHRFERGVDPTLGKYAIMRVFYLLAKYSTYDNYCYDVRTANNLPVHIQKKIKIEFNHIKDLLGVNLDNKFIVRTLTLLNFKPSVTKNSITVRVPSNRFDINIPEDLIEEIARVYGYDNITSTPDITQKKISNNTANQLNNYLNIFVTRGYNEVISFSLLPRKIQKFSSSDKNIISIQNPISEDKSELRTSMIYSMIDTYKYNATRQQFNIKIFESGKIYKSQKKKIIETNIISGLLSGLNSGFNLKADQNLIDFFDMKGDLMSIFHNITFKPSNSLDYLEKSSQAMIYQNKKLVGHCGEVKKSLYSDISRKYPLYFFEILPDNLHHTVDVKYNEISIFPKVKRDLTILLDDKISGQDIIDKVERMSLKQLKNIRISDIFYNEKDFRTNEKSMTFELIFQDKKSTLTDKKVNNLMILITQEVQKHLEVKIRS